MCMGEDRNPGGEDDKRVTSKAASSSSSSSSMSLRLHGVDPMFDKFIEKNREHFRLEKDDSFERRNYYTLWPYLPTMILAFKLILFMCIYLCGLSF